MPEACSAGLSVDFSRRFIEEIRLQFFRCTERDQDFHARSRLGADDELSPDLSYALFHPDEPAPAGFVSELETAAVIDQAQLDFGRTKAQHGAEVSRTRVFH